jgi:hypothetical protein
VDPVPDPLLLRKSGSAGNLTRDLWVCSQEVWPLDHRLAINSGNSRLTDGLQTIYQVTLMAELCYSWRSVGRSVLVSGTHLWLATNFSFSTMRLIPGHLRIFHYGAPSLARKWVCNILPLLMRAGVAVDSCGQRLVDQPILVWGTPLAAMIRLSFS